MKNTYLPINWTDGVKLTKDHFINNYFNSIATVNDYTNVQLNNYNYGIVNEATDTSFEMETKANNSNLEVCMEAMQRPNSSLARNEFLTKMEELKKQLEEAIK